MIPNQTNVPLGHMFNPNSRQHCDSISEVPIIEGKRIMAAKIASSVGSGGAPIKVINAFLQVKDYTGLDRYLSKHMIPADILTSALQKSCMNSDEESVAILSKHGANVNYVDQFGTTLLHFAMRGGGNEAVIVALVSHGLDYTSWRSDGMPLLHWACSRGQIKLVEHIVETRKTSIQEADQNGRLAIHVAAVFGQPEILSYLIQALSKRICLQNVPLQFREDLEDLQLDDDAAKISTHTECKVTSRARKSSAPSVEEHSRKDESHTEVRDTPQTIAAANYLDQHQWTPLHHASCEEAVHLYQECLKILLDHGADPMLPTPQGKTALDLAYGAGRSQVLVDVLPKALLIALLMRIDDIVPPHVRNKRKQVKEDIAQIRALFRDHTTKSVYSPVNESSSPSQYDTEERSKKGYSILRRLAENMEGGGEKSPRTSATDKGPKSDVVNIMSVWRKILLNDSVELLETLRDSLVWREKKTDSNVLQFGNDDLTATADFDAAQKLSLKQMSELFADCYENGNGVYSYVQSKYQQALKAGNFRSVLRSLTGLHTFTALSTNHLVIHRPIYKSLLFLALICGRFRVSEQLLRMRQFDILPAAVIVTLILRRLRKEPSFPQQVISELERFTERIEQIAVDVLNLASLKDNTPEKMICREMLSVPLRAFGEQSMIDLFAKAKCNELLSLPCCQRLLDERWHGVLTNFPNWMRWASKVFPLTGIVYLECQTGWHRKRRNDCSLRKRQSLMVTSRQAFGDPSNIVTNQPWAAVFMGKQKYQVKKEDSKDDQFTFPHPSEEPVTTISVYQRIVGRTVSKTSPRWYFIAGVYRSPAMRFCLHSLLHLLFLCCFSYVCIFSLTEQPSKAEIVSLIYVAAYAIEALRQLVTEACRDGIKEYLKDGWHCIDLLAVGMTTIGFCTRWISDESVDADDLGFTRNFYMIGLNLFYMRTLYITSISQIIGPRLKMMADMLRKDLVPLLIVFAIFICSYGVWFQGLLYPNSRTAEQGAVNVTKTMFKRAFYSIFEVSITLDEENNDADKRGYNIVVYFVLVLYTCIVNIILINLLIALFSNTVSRIDQKATALWLASRYRMVKEYSERTILPPPFNVIYVLYEVVNYVVEPCKRCPSATYTRSKRRSLKVNRMKIIMESETDIGDSDESVDKRGKSDELRIRSEWLQQTKLWNRAIRVSHGKPNAENWEQDTVLKFILLQSFALQDRRQILGTGLGGQLFAFNPVSEQPNSDETPDTETPALMVRMQQQMERMERKMEQIASQFATINPPASSQTSKLSPTRMPIPLRMPRSRLGKEETKRRYDTSPTHIPTAKEIFAQLSKQNSFSSKSDTGGSATPKSPWHVGTISLTTTPSCQRRDKS